jgi:siderophore ferric iron reductase
MSNNTNKKHFQLNQCLNTVQQALPALAGYITTRLATDDTSLQLHHLLSFWSTASPEAGSSYWASQSWAMWIWQPAYFSVLAVHLNQCLPNIKLLSQKETKGHIAGFSIQSHEPHFDNEHSLIQMAGKQLLQLWPSWYKLFIQHQLFPIKLAECILADCILAALLIVPQNENRWNKKQLFKTAEQWLQACKLHKRHAFLSLELNHSQTVIGLNRRTCCQYFRCTEGIECNSCPRRSLSDRNTQLLKYPECIVATL